MKAKYMLPSNARFVFGKEYAVLEYGLDEYYVPNDENGHSSMQPRGAFIVPAPQPIKPAPLRPLMGDDPGAFKALQETFRNWDFSTGTY